MRWINQYPFKRDGVDIFGQIFLIVHPPPQMEAMIRAAAKEGASVRMHVLFDGRDVPDGSSVDYLAQLEKVKPPILGLVLMGHFEYC